MGIFHGGLLEVDVIWEYHGIYTHRQLLLPRSKNGGWGPQMKIAPQ